MKGDSLLRVITAGSSRIGHDRQVTLSAASERDRRSIYGIRHEVYAGELIQHPRNDAGSLHDPMDDFNDYIVAKIAGTIVGFVSITPPDRDSYSIDKYISRETLPILIDRTLYEVRLLTVLKAQRGSDLAALLMYAAFRWVESHGGERIMAIGRREILDLYLKVGLERLGIAIRSGAVVYELLHARVAALRERVASIPNVAERLEEKTDWALSFPFRKPAACFHGGGFFKAVGERFDALERSSEVINADVLDAWFPPSPAVLNALQQHLPWLLRTSPPTACDGLIEVIARVRGVGVENILLGAGSSDLIFRAFREWLTPASHVLILDPTYGEYAHVLESVIGCTVDRLTLSPADHYKVDIERLEVALHDNYDLVVLVNPNSPTGKHIARNTMEEVLRRAPRQRRIWIDETYVDYAGAGESLEQFAARSENVVVCKSMSKTYALSGVRVGYLCASPHQLESLRAITPPWVVSLPAQTAAVNALLDVAYYAARYSETHTLREELANDLRALGWDVVPGIANFLLCRLPPSGPAAAAVIAACESRHLFLRNAAAMGLSLGDRAIRVAVKDAATNTRMVEVLRDVLESSEEPSIVSPINSLDG